MMENFKYCILYFSILPLGLGCTTEPTDSLGNKPVKRIRPNTYQNKDGFVHSIDLIPEGKVTKVTYLIGEDKSLAEKYSLEDAEAMKQLITSIRKEHSLFYYETIDYFIATGHFEIGGILSVHDGHLRIEIDGKPAKEIQLVKGFVRYTGLQDQYVNNVDYEIFSSTDLIEKFMKEEKFKKINPKND